ncbi:MAG: ribokinase [Rhodanobacteraceae bacterium]|nr:ribokinase [Pseudomonadota bacterium]
MSASPQVIVVGSYVQDHAWLVDKFPQPGETRRARGFNTGPGGKGFNQAVACSRQRVPTLFIGAIGEDHLGADARRFAEAEGMPCRWKILDDAFTSASSIVVDASGQNLIAVDLAANEKLGGEFVRAQRDAFARAKLLLTQLESDLDAVATALELGQAADLVCVLNPAPVHPELTLTLLRAADVITPNETEFSLLCARFLDIEVHADALTQMNDSTLHTLARRLTDASVVVTLGRHGCFVSHDEQQRRGDTASFYRMSGEMVNAIDSTGAGDAFSGALAAAMLRFADRPFAAAVRHANRAAAMSTEIVGTAPAMPRYDEVIARFHD